ncbi:MAG: hypothetical protein MK212_04415 [Saprospiraceae bacterium]|nr:hypothetical protein [Saprospiraceae bacterium]
MDKIAETSYSLFYQYQKDIVYSKMKTAQRINIEDVKESMEVIRSFVPQGKKILYIADLSKLRGMDKDARDFAEKSTVFSDMIIANAMLVSNSISRMVGNFLIGWNKGSIPAKLFTDIDKAVEWLRTFRTEKRDY